MGPVRAHDGSTIPNRHHRGKIAQTCSNGPCHWTTLLTQTAYFFDDAQKLAQQIQSQRLGNPIRYLEDDYILRFAEAIPLDHSNGSLQCSNPSCCLATDKLRRRKASKLCVQQMCSTCCLAAYQYAVAQGLRRDSCRPHNQPVSDAGRSTPSSQVAASSHIASSTTLPDRSTVSTRMIEPIEAYTLPSPLSDPPKSQSQTQPPGIDAIRPTTRASLNQRKARTLSMPIAPAVLEEHSIARRKADEIKSAKQQHLDSKERKKRTCEIVFYYENGKPPLKVMQYVPNYPDLAVCNLDAFQEFNLDKATFLDFWSRDGTWMTIRIETNITVDREKPVILRLRPSATMSLTDCPGLDDECLRLSKHRLKSNKRTAQDVLVSPPRKIAKYMAATDSESVVSNTHEAGFRTETPSEIVSDSPIASESNSTNRRWPTYWTISELQAGLERIKTIIHENPHITEKSIFSTVFSGCPYQKSSVGRVKETLRNTTPQIIKHYAMHTWKSFNSLTKSNASGKPNIESEGQKTSSQPPRLSIPSETQPQEPGSQPEAPTLTLPFPEIPPLFLDAASEPMPDSLDSSSDILDLPPMNAFDELFGFNPDTPLCQFCDDPITPHPSRTLREMQEKLIRQTLPDPLPCNPNHRRAQDFTIYQAYCDRHELETISLPTARAAGWLLTPISTVFISVP
ncbi:hypothetical protein QCA50_012604 [Cerrena zonata]|uniref:Uncharacterized protein n=1 Tax=Cerrena zonata TaxID=2478898 RepID=A0AAW0G5K9_9APHY